MALLEDGRRCTGLVVDRLNSTPAVGRCTYRIALLHAGDQGALAPFLAVRGNPTTVDEVRQLVHDIDGLLDGSSRALFHETLDEGFSFQVEDEGTGLRIEVWLDLVRLNHASRRLAGKGEPQAGLRFHTTPSALRRFQVDLADDLSRMGG